MKPVTFIIVLIGILHSTGSMAQQTSNWRFSSITQAGVMYGSTTSDFQVQTINGIRYKTVTMGLGVGLDYYYWRSIPVFVDFRKYFNDKPNTPYVYVDLGMNMPWIKNVEKTPWRENKYNRGFYGGAGVGYKVSLNSKISLNFGLGFSRKELHETQSYFFVNNLPPFERTETFKEYFSYDFNRVSFTAGLSF